MAITYYSTLFIQPDQISSETLILNDLLQMSQEVTLRYNLVI